jgi:transposase-like protein
LLPEARRLRAQGLSPREIAEQLGVEASAVSAWLSAAQAARRLRNAGVCIDCGGATKGGSQPARALRCDACQRKWQTLNGWSRERVIAVFRRWAVEHEGVYPSASAWNSSRAAGGDYPCVVTV